MGRFLAIVPLVLFLTMSTPATSAIPKYNTESDNCTSFVDLSKASMLPPYDLGISLSLLCDPDNNFCQSLNEIIANQCVNELEPSFYNPLLYGLATGEIYMRRFVADLESRAKIISAIPQLSSMSVESDNCTAFQEVADSLTLKPYDLGLTLSVVCDRTNDYCKKLSDLINDVCVDKLPSNFYYPLNWGLGVGRSVMISTGEHLEDHKAAYDRLTATVPSWSNLTDDCGGFQEVSKIIHLDPFGVGLSLSMLCVDIACCKKLQATSEHCGGRIPPAFHAPLDAGLNLGETYREILKKIVEHNRAPLVDHNSAPLVDHNSAPLVVNRTIPMFNPRRHGCSWFPEVAEQLHLQPYGLGASLDIFCEATDSCRQMDDLLNNVCVNELAPKFYVPLRTGRVYMKGICVATERCWTPIDI